MSSAAPARLQPCRCSDDPPTIDILDISYIKPLHPTQPRFHLRLSHFDSIFAHGVYIRLVFYFSLPHPAKFDLQAIKHGLSAVLVPFYPLAGCLNDDDDATAPPTIDCNDAGVEFVEATTDLDFADLEEQQFPILDGLVRVLSRQGAPPDPPLLSIQVTRFQGGRGSGIAIGVAMHHSVADGHSFFHFLKSWGECCRGLAVSLPPLHIRALMEPECWGIKKYSTPRFHISHPGMPAPAVMQRAPPGAAYCRVMHFDSSAAQELKQTAIAESGNSRISTFQAVIACVWKRICAAEDLPSHKEVRMNIVGNMRHVMMPSMTDAYFGNAVQDASTSMMAGDLQGESVGAIAARINERVQLLKEEGYLRRKLETAEESLAEFFRDLLQLNPVQFYVGQGSKMPAFDVDVGMGKPVAVRPDVIDNSSTLVVLRGREEGSVDVCVQLGTQQKLEAFLSIPCPCAVDI